MNKTFHSILITGASSGIGAALAKHYAAADITLFLMGRHAKRLQDVSDACTEKKAIVHYACIDIISEDDMNSQITAWDKDCPIDLVIANAGISNPKGVETKKEVENVLDVNINGVINTIYPLIPAMKSRQAGTIAIMSSLAGFRGMPTAVSYSASKNAVRAMGDALRPELKKHSIDVTVICPGFIRTPLTDVNPFPMPLLMEPEQSARIIAQGLANNKKRISFPSIMRIMVWLMASLPLCITDPFLNWSSQRKRKE